ncbi:MAG: hypothetical protein HC802_12210 [Caldilineaceae bacterium]|nr:hypothetical protein [Caldilineaceae bacterium]
MQAVLRTQLAAQMAALPDPEGMMALYDEAVARFIAGEPIDPSPDLPEGVQQLLLGFEAPVNLPFTRELLVADPAEWLAAVEAPVLILIGKKDIQIDWELDGQPLEAAVADRETVTFVYPENANHVFKYEEKPAEDLTANDGASYNVAGRVLDDESLAIMLDWLAAQ